MPSTPSETSPAVSGLWYMAGAAFFWSVMSLFVKLVGQRLPSQQIVFVRSAVTLAYSYLLIRWSAEAKLWGENKRLLWLRGLLGFGALSCFFFSLTKLPLADATVLQYTNPVWTALIAAVAIDEPIEPAEVGGILLSLAGVTLIAQPSFLFGSASAGLNLLYVGIALLGALFSASAYVTVRKMRETEHPLVIVFYFPLVSTLGAGPTAAWADAQWPTAWEWLVLVGGVAGCAQVAQVCLTKGLHEVKAGRAMSVSYMQIVFAAAWGVAVFGEVPDAWSVAGAALVVSGIVITAGR